MGFMIPSYVHGGIQITDVYGTVISCGFVKSLTEGKKRFSATVGIYQSKNMARSMLAEGIRPAAKITFCWEEETGEDLSGVLSSDPYTRPGFRSQIPSGWTDDI